jgi:DNA replication licensing factor MCM6
MNCNLSICRVIFTGTVIVIPDILALASPGERSECRREASQRKGSSSGNEGVRGLRALGVRDLSYRLAFIANSVQVGYLWFVIVIFVFYDLILFL